MEATVIVVDDDASVRASLENLLRSVGLRVKTLGSLPDFVNTGRPKEPTCLVLDVRLPGQSGLDFQRTLAAANIRMPIVFITAHGDVRIGVRAMRQGAIEFLTKPFSDQDLLDAIHLALATDRDWLEREKNLASLRARYNTLSVRERQVMALVVRGRLNKQIAADIGIGETTVKLHRAQVMHKMQAPSLPDLARMADKLSATGMNGDSLARQ